MLRFDSDERQTGRVRYAIAGQKSVRRTCHTRYAFALFIYGRLFVKKSTLTSEAEALTTSGHGWTQVVTI